MGCASQGKLRGHFLNPAKSLAFGLVRGAAFGKLLIQPSRLATTCAFAPRLAVRTREGLARTGDFGTQRFANTLRLGSFVTLADAQAEILGGDAVGVDFLDQFLDDGSHGFLALLFGFGLQLEALSFKFLDLGIDIYERNNGYSEFSPGLFVKMSVWLITKIF